MKKFKVDPAVCIGCGTCTALASNSFKMGEEGKAHAQDSTTDPEETVQNAIDSCPVGAISWVD